jgi:hypothetical protein
MATLGPRILLESVKTMSNLMEQAVEVSPKIPGGITRPQPKALCEIPESECPPRCVCEIDWEASRRERLHCLIKVTNSSRRQRVFTIRARPFPGAAGTIQIAPDSLTLEPGQSGDVRVYYGVPEGLAAGAYKTEILVTGAYEQCISVNLNVVDEYPCVCHVVQGEIPVRVRAHHWYDHFQCIEPCFEPAKLKEYEKKEA